MKQLNQVKAVMLGHAVGDALGVPAEFRKREELDSSPITDMVGYGTYPYPAGCWSDDTSMALAALDSLAHGTLDFDDILQRFGQWYYHGEYTPTGSLFDVGGTCSLAIQRYCTDHLPIAECGLADVSSNGNGSLMRIHPFVLMTRLDRRPLADAEAVIDNASALTHAHERSKLACRIYALILLHLLNTPTKESVKQTLQLAARRYRNSPEADHYSRLFSPDFEALPHSAIRSTGYVVDTLEAAVWCLLTTDGYRECVLKAVNLGEDTDTVAAIAGGLAGALYGYGAIPQEWLDVLKRREYIEEMCDRAVSAWSKA